MENYARLTTGDDSWLEIQPGVDRIVERCGTPQSYIDSVRKALQECRAFLFLAPDGWFIAQPHPKHLNLLLGAASPSAFPHLEKQVHRLAELAGAGHIEFVSPRKGWGRRAAEKGWEVCESKPGFYRYRKYRDV